MEASGNVAGLSRDAWLEALCRIRACPVAPRNIFALHSRIRRKMLQDAKHSWLHNSVILTFGDVYLSRFPGTAPRTAN